MGLDSQLSWMQIDDAASALGVSVRTLYRRVKKGEYPTEKRNGRLFVAMSLSEDMAEPLTGMPDKYDIPDSSGRHVRSGVTDATNAGQYAALREREAVGQELDVLRLKLEHAEEQHEATRREYEAAQREHEMVREMLGSDVEHLRGLTTQQAETIQNLSEEMKGLTIALHHEQNQRLALESHSKDENEDEDEKPKKAGLLRRVFARKPKRKHGKFARVGPSSTRSG